MRSKQQFLSVFFIIILLNRWFKKIYVYSLVVLVDIGLFKFLVIFLGLTTTMRHYC